MFIKLLRMRGCIISVIMILSYYGYAQSTAQQKRDSLASSLSFKDISMGGEYVYRVNGLLMSRTTYDSLRLYARDISHRKVLSKNDGPKTYGTIAKDGIIIIETSKLLIVDGRIIKTKDQNSISEIMPADIVSVRNLDADELRERKKIRSKRGAILVKTKT